VFLNEYSTMSRRTVKREVLRILVDTDLERIKRGLERYQENEVVNPLFTALCAANELVKWHAVSAFGWIVPAIADQDTESARVIMRRFLWSLNDESGGIGWGVPEAMAEVMAMDRRLADEYLHMLISYTREDGPELFQDGNYIELPMLQRGLLWGIGRLCAARRAMMRNVGVGTDLATYLDSPDGVVRGMALWALANLGDGAAADEVKRKRLRLDHSEIPIYWEGVQTRYSMGELTKRYLQAVGKG